MGKRKIRRPRRTWYPEQLTVRTRQGVRERIERAAEGDGMDSAQWMRDLIDRGLEAARKRREYRAARLDAGKSA